MENLMFVLKCLAITLVVVVILQIRVGPRTLEGHTMAWLHHSSIAHHLDDVAEGAVKVGKKAQQSVASLVGSHDEEAASAPNSEASQGAWFKIKRSKAYERQRALERERAEKEKEKAASLESGSDDDKDLD